MDDKEFDIEEFRRSTIITVIKTIILRAKLNALLKEIGYEHLMLKGR